MRQRRDLATARHTAFMVSACVIASLSAFAGCGGDDEAPAPVCDNPSTDLFDARIAPLLADDQPRTCNQCHLSGIDLSAIVRDSPCESMACLIDADMVDLDDPPKSSILTWITRAEPESELITQDVIDLEYQAFLEWIQAEADCRACANTHCGEKDDEPVCKPVASGATGVFDFGDYEGDCSDRTLEFLFMETVYASRGRCYPCHFTSNTTVTAEKWISTVGNCEAASLTTMRNVIDDGYVDLEDPTQSLLLLKPLSERNGGVPHGGHDKFTPQNDPSYTNFLNWVTFYADCQADTP